MGMLTCRARGRIFNWASVSGPLKKVATQTKAKSTFQNPRQVGRFSQNKMAGIREMVES